LAGGERPNLIALNPLGCNADEVFVHCSQSAKLAQYLLLLAATLYLVPLPLPAQLTTGILEATLQAPDGRLLPNEPVIITGAAGFHITARTGSDGGFSIALPYGQYQLTGGASIVIVPLEIMHAILMKTPSGEIEPERFSVSPNPALTGGAEVRVSPGQFPEGFSLQALLLSREPSTVTEPLDFAGLADNRTPVTSQDGFPWTDMQYKLQGLDASDSYQPGFAVFFPDVQSGQVTASFSPTTSTGYYVESNPLFSQSDGSWHASFETGDTGRALSSTNLPPAPLRGLVEQPDRSHWLTRNHFTSGGPLTRFADLFVSATGQWSSQTEPLSLSGTQDSRLLFGNARARIRLTPEDQLDLLYSGSRVDLSNGGMPAGIEALTGNRMAPSFVLPGGFLGEPERDGFDFFQAGWSHVNPQKLLLGTIEVRYGFSTAHLNTYTEPETESRIELAGGIVSGAPPLANLAVRPRQELETVWQPVDLKRSHMSNRVLAGGGWQTSEPRNRFTAPSNINLITAGGVPAFVMELNTPDDSRELVRSGSAYVADQFLPVPSLSLEAGAAADFSRGGVPSPIPALTGGAELAGQGLRSDLIVWNSVSPHAGLAWRAPRSRGLILRGNYSRLYTPIAGRYLDYGDPESLGGSLYFWNSSNASAPFEPSQMGSLVLRFGGPYSSISPILGRPYSDTFNVGAESSPLPHVHASIRLFRRDDKNRIAAVDTGVPASAFTPVTILDPGPSGIPGGFGNQQLTVYAQNPATFGQDRYLLTNPPGLRFLNTGLTAQLGVDWLGIAFHAWFTAEKSYGPTNPGDSFLENDPGVIGSLFLDPNTDIHAAGRIFMDRAFVGKLQASYRLPARWGGIQLASVADYTDGLVFARQLLVEGLPQGPFLVATTVRGSPEGGNRAEYAIDWNLRLAREFALARGKLTVTADILNVANAGQSLQENDVSGTSFNLRLPVAIQAPRFARLEMRYEF
jgi:hypothetical protein